MKDQKRLKKGQKETRKDRKGMGDQFGKNSLGDTISLHKIGFIGGRRRSHNHLCR